MTESKFTPGPWTWSRRENATGFVKGACISINAGPPAGDEDDDNSICGIWGVVDETDEANARLIAAAPALYEALAELVGTNDMRVIGDDSPEQYKARRKAAWAKARAALTQANGPPQTVALEE